VQVSCAVVEQQKKWCGGKLVLGCFFDLAFDLFAGHVWKSVEKREISAEKCV
jgi:hypothetical protein